MSAQDHSTPVDIIAQTLKDIRTKPFWDTYEDVSGSFPTFGLTQETIGSGTYEGVLLNGYIRCLGLVDLQGFQAIYLKLDGIVVAAITSLTLFSYLNQASSLPFEIIRWEFDDKVAIINITREFHFQVSWEVVVLVDPLETLTFQTIFQIGKNT